MSTPRRTAAPTPIGGRASIHADLRRGVRLTLVVASFSVLSAGLPLSLIFEVPDVGRSNAWQVTILVMIWGGLRLSLLWVAGRPQLFDFFFWLFCYIFMGLAPTVQLRADAVSTTTQGIDSSLDLPAAGVVALGIICYEGARSVWSLRSTSTVSAQHLPRSVSPMRTGILVVLGLAMTAYFVYRVGPTGALGSRDAAGAARSAAWPDPALRAVFYAAASYPLLVATGALMQLRRTNSSPAVRATYVVCAIACSAVLLLVVNPVASARYTFGTVAFALVVYAGAMATKLTTRLTLLATIVAFLFVFPIADAFRTVNTGAERRGFFDEYLNNPDYDSFWQIANALSYWIDGLVQPGLQFLGSLFFWVPRAIWPDKPTDTGILLAEYRGYSFDNLSAPVWAEALVNGGLIAVIVVFLVIGIAYGAMDRRITISLRDGGVWAIAGAIFPVFTTILLRGSLLQATGAAVVTVACLLFIAGRREDRAFQLMPVVQAHSTARPPGRSSG